MLLKSRMGANVDDFKSYFVPNSIVWIITGLLNFFIL